MASERKRPQFDYALFPLAQVFVQPALRNSEHHMSGLGSTLPKNDIDRDFKKPTVKTDGTIFYEPSQVNSKAIPDDIQGYRRDEANPFLFHPVWPHCIARLFGTQVKPDGCIDVKMACNHPHAATFGQPVSLDKCKGCVMRTQTPPDRPNRAVPPPAKRDFKQPTIQPDGRLVYEKTGWEPPVCPDGYHRDPNDMWAFIPMWQPCADRTFENTVRPCGCVTVKAKCHSSESGYEGQQVPSTVCIGCPVRREAS